MSRDEARALTKKILSFARVPELHVTLGTTRRGYLRFARNASTTSGAVDSATVGVTAWKGKRKASLSATVDLSPAGIDEAALKRLVAGAEELAAISPEDREYVPLLGPQEYLEVDAYDASSANVTAKRRAQAVGEAIAYAKNKKVVAAGFFENRDAVSVMANSKGLFSYFPSSGISFSVTARTTDGTGSGYYATSSLKISTLDVKEAAAIAVKKALDSRNPREIKPGAYPTILEAQAVSNLIPYLYPDARRADEGRGVYAAPDGKTRLGEKIFDSRISVYGNPAHPVVPSNPAGPGGYPAAKDHWIEKGVLKNLVYSRYWAAKQKRRPGPFLSNLIIGGENTPLAKMIASTERGVLVTRLWYIRMVDPQQALVTGLTRDGTFWIEDGEIRHPIKNFRFNDSIVRLLGDVDSLGTPQRVGTQTLVPPIKVNSFRFTSLSDAI